MIKSKILKDHLKKNSKIFSVLDVGCEYPFRLISLIHEYGAQDCIGVDLIEEESLVPCSLVEKEISKNSDLTFSQVTRIVSDYNPKVQNYLSYKLYTTLVLNKPPCQDCKELKSRLKIHFNKSIQQYLNGKRNDNKGSWIKFNNCLENILTYRS